MQAADVLHSDLSLLRRTVCSSALRLGFESESCRGDETLTDTEEVAAEVTPVQTQFMVKHRLRPRRDCVKTETWKTSAATRALPVMCVCVSVTVHADVRIRTVREGVSGS